MDVVTQAIFDFIRGTPLVGVLLIMMGADIVSGIMVAIANKKLNSQTSMMGMIRKVFILLLVGIAAVLEPHADDIPLTKLVAGCFVATELLSIVENAIRLGVPVPKVMRDVLAKFRDDSETQLEIPAQTIPVRLKRKSDYVEVHDPPPKQAADQEGCNPPGPPS